MLNTLNFKHIYYFWVVALEGSIVKAGTKVNVSNSSISEQIKILENRLGVDLFERRGKSLVLTDYGERVFNQVNPFFSSTEELFESIINHKKMNVRFLRIGIVPGIPEEERYSFTFPFVDDINYTVRLLKGENSSLKKEFENGELDMILTINENLIPKKQAERFIIKEEKHVFVCSQDFYKDLPSKPFPQKIHKKKFINFTNDSDIHFSIYDYFHSHSVNPLRIAEIDDIYVSRRLVLDGQGFALLPSYAVQKEIKEKKLVLLHEDDRFNRSVMCYFHKSFKEERFLNHLKRLTS
jgi:LysR family transcriptional activator of nhaA